MKTKNFDRLVTAAGLLLLAAGFILLKTAADPRGIMLTLPYVCIGLGCGAFGHGIGKITAARAEQSDPQLRRRMEIERKDERNIAISDKAKARAYDAMIYVYGAMMLAFGLMGADMTVILLLFAAYLSVIALFVWYHSKFSKEM